MPFYTQSVLILLPSNTSMCLRWPAIKHVTRCSWRSSQFGIPFTAVFVAATLLLAWGNQQQSAVQWQECDPSPASQPLLLVVFVKMQHCFSLLCERGMNSKMTNWPHTELAYLVASFFAGWPVLYFLLLMSLLVHYQQRLRRGIETFDPAVSSVSLNGRSGDLSSLINTI